MPQRRGEAQKSVRIVRRISYENRILSDRIMEVETPIPPIMIVAAAPDGAPPRRISNDISEKHRTARRAPEGPGGGEPS